MQALASSEIKIGLIDGNHLYDGRELLKDPVDLARVLAVFAMLTAQEDRVRAEFFGRPNRHGGVNAKFARLVTCRRHHATSVGVGAHHHGFALQRRILKLLHRYEECVHVDMENLTEHGAL